nr:glycoside hydrolase family 88 protein [uncultured Acetatifactor sp.]
MISIADLKERMERVNDYWIAQNPEPGNCAWERAAYFLGNMAAIEVLKKPRYLEYAVEWAQANHWNFYDNAAHCTVNADNVSCGETYLDLMENYGILGKMEHIRATMEWTASDPHNDYWWWVDTMYMALHFYNRMGLLLEDDRLIDKAYRLYLNAKEERHLYDREEKLWFRDENFLPEIARTAGGRKVFWARGNGWVFAGLARTLRTLPPEQKYYREYREVFTGMAQALEKCQCGDGLWRTSLLEPEEYPMPETSGTVLTVLGMVIGVRLGILPERYMECALRGFDALNREAVEASGRIGWVQVVALKPGPVKKEDSNDYAVGTYLLVCRELIAYFSR